MARQRRPSPGADNTEARPPAPPPPVPVEVATGLEAIRMHGGRDEELYLSADGAFFEESFMTDRIVTAEESVRFIKKIEAIIRGSAEYKAYIGYLRADLGMDHCSFLPNLDMSMDEIGLEMHHAPLTLYAIVDIVITHRLARGQAVTSLSVADEVMRMHFENKIGLVPLCRSAHKLVHSGALTIAPQMVHGAWVEFLRDYPDGATEETVAQLLAFVSVTEDIVMQAAVKIDGNLATPRLRADTTVPSREEVGLLLMAPPG
jgi:hypothetical protein